MTVSELIEELKEMPQEIEVLAVISCESFSGDTFIEVESAISAVDMRDIDGYKFVTLKGY